MSIVRCSDCEKSIDTDSVDVFWNEELIFCTECYHERIEKKQDNDMRLLVNDIRKIKREIGILLNIKSKLEIIRLKSVKLREIDKYFFLKDYKND